MNVVVGHGDDIWIQEIPNGARVAGYMGPAPKGMQPGDEKFLIKEGKSFRIHPDWPEEILARLKALEWNDSSSFERLKQSFRRNK